VYKKLITGLVSDMSEEKQQHLQKVLAGLRDKMMQEMHMELRKPAVYPPDEPIPVIW
jgi:hypothetical protein